MKRITTVPPANDLSNLVAALTREPAPPGVVRLAERPAARASGGGGIRSRIPGGCPLARTGGLRLRSVAVITMALLAPLGLLASWGCEGTGVGPDVSVANGSELEPAIVNGTPDGNGHPNVGVLAFDLDGEAGPSPPFGRCTGSVLSDHVFLTAAHCIEGIPSFAQWAVTLEPGSLEDPVVLPGVFPDRVLFPVIRPVVYADQVVLHPQFDGDPASARRHDVAVLVFPTGTFDGVTPVELPEEGALDDLAAGGGLQGQTFTLVGYGAAPIAGEVMRYSVLGYRQVAEAPFEGLSPDWLHLLMTGEATDAGGLCIADSGSPHFPDDSNVAMAILGGGGISDACGTGVTRSQRLDTAPEVDFLAQFLEQ